MATNLSYLTVVRGRSGAWPLQAQTPSGRAATGIFTGSEALTVQVFYGADAALAVLATAAWIDGPSGQYVLSLPAAQSALLAPGSYTLVVVAAPTAADGPLLEATLVVEPAPTDGTGYLRALAQPGEHAAAVPQQANNPAVAAALEAATASIEAYCNRPLVLGDYDRRHRPGRTRRIYLDAWPVQGEPTLTDGIRVVATIRNGDATTNQAASVSMTPVAPGSGQPATLTLRRTASGIETVDVLTLSAYATISALLDAVTAAGGGWSVDAPGSGATPSLLLLPPSRLAFAAGRQGALDRPAELRVYAVELSGYVLDPLTGVIELGGIRPQAFRYPDRAVGFGYGFAWGGSSMVLHADVRCQYRAGYATTQADLAAGYDPVPHDLRMATILVAESILQAPGPIGAVSSQSISTQKTVVRRDASTIPPSARTLLNNYMNYRMGGWGT